MAALAPDVILVSGNVVIAPMLQAARTTPIVFVQVIDPVGSGFVESMARPGGNVTGFTQFEYNLAGKWLELLKEIDAGPAGEDAPAFAGARGPHPRGGATGAWPAALTARGDQWSDREQLGYEAAVAELTSSSRKAIGSWV